VNKVFRPIAAILLVFLSIKSSRVEAFSNIGQDIPANYRLLKTIRILTLNVYGKKEKRCASRLKAIGKKVLAADPPYDIVSFNEHYDPMVKLWLSCDGDYLTNEMLRDGRYKDEKGIIRYHQQYPNGRFYQANGGNSLFTLHNITKFDYWKFTNHRKFVANGYLFNRIKISKDLSIDFWTAHLEAAGGDDCSEACRIKQTKELLLKIKKHRRGNPVIVAGDFNIGGPRNQIERQKHLAEPVEIPYRGNSGYEKIIKLFDYPRDVWLEKNSSMEPIDSYTYDCYRNTTTKKHCEDFYRIDYLFIPTSLKFQNPNYKIEIVESKVTRWKTDSGIDVSDHYGVEATLNIYKRFD